MNFKIVLAVALFVSGGSFIASAQQKATAAKTVSISQTKAFTSKIDAFEKTTEPAKASALLNEMKQQITEGFGKTKGSIANARNSGNTAEADRLQQQLQKQTGLYGKLMQATATNNPENKQETVSILKSIAKEMK